MNKNLAKNGGSVKIYALEFKNGFLFEKRGKTYKWYVERVSQKKNSFWAKSDYKGQACIGLERHGA